MSYPSGIKVNGKLYRVNYKIVKKGTSSVRVKNGEIDIRLSRYLFGFQKDKTINNFLQWAAKKLSKVSGGDLILPIYKDGGRICTHNKVYDLEVREEDRKNSKVKLKDRNLIEISIDKRLNSDQKMEVVKELAEKIIIKDQTSYLEEVIEELNQLYFQEEYNLCRFKRSRSRFGSCSMKGNLNISYRLLFAPREVFRYVCVHELAHLREMNHSKKFWELVAGAMPDYKESEKWLRNNGFMLG